MAWGGDAAAAAAAAAAVVLGGLEKSCICTCGMMMMINKTLFLEQKP